MGSGELTYEVRGAMWKKLFKWAWAYSRAHGIQPHDLPTCKEDLCMGALNVLVRSSDDEDEIKQLLRDYQASWKRKIASAVDAKGASS